MGNIRALGIVTVVLVFGIAIGHFSTTNFSGNVILTKVDRPDSNIQGNIIKPAFQIEAGPGDKCKDVICKPSSLKCPDDFNSSCSNMCSDGICSSCKPDCKGHGKINSTGAAKTSISPAPAKTSIATSGGSDFSGTQDTCSENWSCSDWVACLGGQQGRACTDSNNCGTTNNKPAETQACTESQGQKQLSISLSVSNQTIVRGNDIIVTAKITENQLPIEGAVVAFIMTYASGKTKATNSNVTNSQGLASWTKRIGGGSDPGTFKVDAKTAKSGYSDGTASITFEVVNATG